MEAFVSSGAQWRVLAPLALAMVCSSLIGVERELAAKSAGLRTHALVGLGAAAFMLISKYGFGDLVGLDHVSLDPSRVAAQVVSGIGFVGGGLIFVRRDAVRGLTTAATVWTVAAVGMACGAGLPVLGVAGTAGHYLVTRGFRPLARLLRQRSAAGHAVAVTYLDGRGVLRSVLTVCTERGFAVTGMRVDREEGAGPSVLDAERSGAGSFEGGRVAAVTLTLAGRGSLHALAGELSELPGAVAVSLPGDPEDGHD